MINVYKIMSIKLEIFDKPLEEFREKDVEEIRV